MRFLLHPAAQRASSQGLRKGGKPTKKVEKNLASSSVLGTSTQKNDARDTPHVQTWGQQCSPSCGCVVRFEATVDPSTNKFTSATYHAKSVLVTRNSQKNGALEPAMTLRKNRPMFRPCNCKSLHKLASRVAEYLPNQNRLQMGSNMEFAGVRSSPAFRHTVLEKQGLNSADTHCFDVVEEALTAMVKGHMPKSREQVSLREAYSKEMEASPFKFEQQRGEATEEDYDFRMIDLSTILTAPRAMSALRMLDVKADYSPFGFDKEISESESRYDTRKKEETLPPYEKKLDWVTYVDSLYEKEASA